MIGTFWSMCRACPSVPVDKLNFRLRYQGAPRILPKGPKLGADWNIVKRMSEFHSEYRSTYRWHEYTGPRQEIIRRPPTGSFTGEIQEPALPRRKKHPELAYRVHRILTESGSEALLKKTFFYDRARSEERWTASQEKNSRRSKSEGPPAGKPSYHLIYSKPLYSFAPNRPSKDRKTFFNDENETPKSSPVFSNRSNIIQSEPPKSSPKKDVFGCGTSYTRTAQVLQKGIDSPNQPKKSISMNGLKNKELNQEETVPVHKRTAELKYKSDVEVFQNVKANPGPDNSNVEDATHRRDDTDGEFKSEYKKNFQPFNRYEYDENKGVFEKRTAPLNSQTPSEMESPSSSWYKEVMLLRQKANQYRHRGWGTELVPDHIAQVYNDQIMLWEQVSRRSTLSALSLASSALSRDASPSKEERESKKCSPAKSLTRARSAKATAATHQGKTSERKTAKAPTSKTPADSSPKKGNNQVKKLGIKRTSPNRTSRDSAVGTPPTIHKALNQGVEKSKRRPRPTSLITTVPSGSKTIQQKKKDKADNEVEDFSTVDQEQIVKSPPEPTRVKSPEQIVIRSPEPVNWTVPLDTGKTFTVTQNIREGDLAPRSCSEAKSWALGGAHPPPASLSTSAELLDLAKTNIQGEILTK